MNIRKRCCGFTLLELMIVVAIIGILASVALPTYQDYIVRAQVVEALTLSSELKPAIRDYYRDRGVFPADNDAAGAPAPEHLLGQYVSGIVIEDGAMHVTFGNRAHASIAGEVLSIRPLYVTANPPSPIGFSCGRSGAPQGMSAAGTDRTTAPLQFLPSSCRP